MKRIILAGLYRLLVDLKTEHRVRLFRRFNHRILRLIYRIEA